MLFRILLEGFCGCFCLMAGFSGPDGVTPPSLCVLGRCVDVWSMALFCSGIGYPSVGKSLRWLWRSLNGDFTSICQDTLLVAEDDLIRLSLLPHILQLRQLQT